MLFRSYPGSHIGAYSALKNSPYRYTVKAKGNVSLLFLEQIDLLNFAEIYIEMDNAIESATTFIIENDVPLCDFRICNFVS